MESATDGSPLTDRASSIARIQHNTRWCSVSHMEQPNTKHMSESNTVCYSSIPALGTKWSFMLVTALYNYPDRHYETQCQLSGSE